MKINRVILGKSTSTRDLLSEAKRSDHSFVIAQFEKEYSIIQYY